VTAADSAQNGGKTMVNLTIDGKPVSVPAGTNVIEAAKTIGVEIPHYCYHKNLSIAGNCRMCQIEIKGMRKLEIGCNAVVKEGMEVATQHTSKTVSDAQAATLEFILINHPLDCTVCDQAGHCKLQDYHFEYNAKQSRFLEEKEHKVKAEPLGPTVMLDGERCILCTRCVRFCDEVTETSELGVLNRGDRSVIAINQGRELNNPLSGTVVDLCPVGALTHREWRFNSRIWFTKQTDSVCPGCSTGCNTKIAVRDREVVQVKARDNQAVNKEWMCDEGRYGMGRFLPKGRQLSASIAGTQSSLDNAIKEAAATLKNQRVVVFVAPDMTLEEYTILKGLLGKYLKGATTVLAHRERKLTKTEAILISPDYSPNFRGAEFTGLVSGDFEASYADALDKFRAGGFQHALFIGDRSVMAQDLNPQFLSALAAAPGTVAIVTDADSALAATCKVVLPGRSILEKSGLMINRAGRLQYTDRIVEYQQGSEAEWRLFNRLAEQLGGKLVTVGTERELTLSLLGSEPRLQGAKLSAVKQGGICLKATLGSVVSASHASTSGGDQPGAV
jgi:NADH-quinone oxidoreductase subunit G